MVPPFANGKDPKFCLQINGNILWEWRKLDGNLRKLFAVLQANLRPNGYRLEESAYDRVSNLLNTKTRTFVNKIKAEGDGKRKQRKRSLDISVNSTYMSKLTLSLRSSKLK